MVKTESSPLSGQVAIVTGAGRGIGRTIAARLAADGAAVVATDLDKESAAQSASDISKIGGTAVPLEVDVTKADHRSAMVEQTLERFARIDILVNNAGIFTAAPPLQVNEASWRSTFSVNSEALFFCCQAVLPYMLKANYGRIVNMSSIAAKVGNPAMIAYNASKAAVIAITRNLGQAFANHGITVNCVLPGIIDTPMWAALEQDVGPLLGYAHGGFMADRVRNIPVGRAGTPEDVSGVVAFLTSFDARYMTGQAINVTGGLLTH